MYIHERENWTDFRWDDSQVSLLQEKVFRKQGLLYGRLSSLGFDSKLRAMAENLTYDVVYSSEIEGSYIITSKLNGKSMFLPACGVFYSNEQQHMNTDGHYWLSTSETSNTFYADYLIFSSDSYETCHKSELFQDYNGRDHGRTIRPVSL